MKKIWKRFMALAIIFASIISFLPIEIGSNGKPANAMTTQIEVSGTKTQDGDNITFVNGEYITKQPYSDFKLTMDCKEVKIEDIPINDTKVTEQEIIITNIDGIDLQGLTPEQKNDKLAGIKTSIASDRYTDSYGKKKLRVTIFNLPLGINKISYKIKEITTSNVGTIDATTKVTTNIYKENEPEYSDLNTIVIQHANSFVQDQIPYIDFFDYDKGRLAEPDPKPESNKVPFLYTQRMESKNTNSLRFAHDLPNSITDMDYKISFPNGIDLKAPDPNNDLIYVNGEKKDDASTEIATDGSPVLVGSLTKLGSTMILISIRHDAAINYTYSIEIQYNGKDTINDYTLRDAGIQKLYFSADSSVKAYIGKQFTTTVQDGILIYTGTITVDKRAEMIGIKPIIGRDPTGNQTTTAYKVSNHYDGGNVEVAKSVNGEAIPYVNFKVGTNNQIWVEIYEGTDGNVTPGKQALAIYKLNVNYTTGSIDNSVIFSVDPTTSYLTQPGRTKLEEAISFTTSRRTYNLNFKNDSINTAKIKLERPSDGREFIKIWGGISSLTDNLTELTGLTQDSVGYTNVDITNYKKIVAQAYYNQTTYETVDGVVKEIITPYPLGEKYTFYIAKNPDKDDSAGTTKSSDASLSNMKVGNGTLRATDGTSIFSSDKTDYTVTVPKVDAISAITATATSSKVKDITATITETGDDYSLTSGQAFDIPLNTTGKTNVKIVVTAEDGVTKKTYNIAINNDTRSATTALKNVVTDKGDFTFDPDKDPNKIRVDQAVNTLKVSPVPEDGKARITVNGTKYTGAPISIDLKGSQKTDMEIKVTSEDGSASKTYYFEIYRTDSPIADNTDNNVDDTFYDEIDDTWVDLSKYEEWGTVDGKTVYFNNKGRQVKNQWINTKGVWYFLDSKGYKAAGWRKEVGGKNYYLDPNTGAVKTGWLNQNNKWYYLGLNGVMQKGWLNLNGHWYYFTPEGEMITNQSMYIDDGIYRFAADGVMY